MENFAWYMSRALKVIPFTLRRNIYSIKPREYYKEGSNHRLSSAEARDRNQVRNAIAADS